MGDPFLNYFALFVLIFVVVVLFYGIIAIHDIPHIIAKSRNHPHQDAIHAAGWVSLFTLHALWPFLWIWAMSYRPERGWGFSTQPVAPGEPGAALASAASGQRGNSIVRAPDTRPEPGSSAREPVVPAAPDMSEIEDLRRRVAALESKLAKGGV